MAEQEGRAYEGWVPIWFEKVPDQYNQGREVHMFKGGYWEAKDRQEWTNCPDIF